MILISLIFELINVIPLPVSRFDGCFSACDDPASEPILEYENKQNKYVFELSVLYTRMHTFLASETRC